MIDPTGTLASGQPVSDPVNLRAAISSEPDKFVQTVAQNLLTFALGRRVEATDMPAVRAIVRDSKAQGYTFESIAIGVAKSAPFRMRTAPEIAPEDNVRDTVAAEQGAQRAPVGTEAGGR
jgi:hypothetical protein